MATKRRERIDNYANSLPQDWQEMNKDDLSKYYYSFDPRISVSNYMASLNRSIPTADWDELNSIAESHKNGVYERLQQLIEEDRNTIEGQVESQKNVGLNPDLVGVSPSPYNQQQHNAGRDPSDPMSDTLNTVGMVFDGLAGLTSAAGSVMGIIKQSKMNTSADLSNAKQAVSLYKDIADLGLEDVESLPLSRRQKHRIVQGVDSIPDSYLKEVASGRMKRTLENLFESDKAESDRKLLPLLTDLQAAEAKINKEYFDTVDGILKARAENASNKAVEAAGNYNAESISNLDPTHEARMQGLQEDSLASDIARNQSTTALNDSIGSERETDLKNRNADFEEFKQIRDAYVKMLDAKIAKYEEKISEYTKSSYKRSFWTGKNKEIPHAPLSEKELRNMQELEGMVNKMYIQRMQAYNARSFEEINFTTTPYVIPENLRDKQEFNKAFPYPSYF